MSSATILYPTPGAAPTSGSQTPGSVHSTQTETGTSTSTGTTVSVVGPTQSGQGTAISPVRTTKLAVFEGFLKKAGQIAGVVLTEIVKYAIPIASVVSVADPATAPAVEAFTASVKLVQATVITAQQRWVTEGSAANTQKLADVLEIVEQPIVTMFAQAGMEVDISYVTNLVNGVVAILNAQPAAVLPATL